MKQVLAMIAFSLPAGAACAAEPETKEYKSAPGQVLPYRLLKPADPEPGQKYPLVLILHGAGERGTDNAKQLIWYWDAKKPTVLTRPEVAAAKAFAVIPQCPDGKQWVDVPWAKGSYKSPKISDPLRLALDLTESLVKDLPVDPDRVYVTGMSMGGYGAFDAVQRRPDLFAAAVPVCGAGDPAKAKAIAHVPVWAFHGDQDGAVPVSGSRDMVAALKTAGASPRYSEYKGVGHNSWSPAFEEKEFWMWLFAQKRAAKK
ncbi:MAG: esterase [Gemmataceae bacterium]|nr:esterase [Gemmataceae bacterium]